MLTQKERERLYGQTLVDFVNTPTLDEAIFGLFEGIQKVLDFSPSFVETAKHEIQQLLIERPIPQKNPWHYFSKNRNILKTLFEHIINGRNFFTDKTIRKFVNRGLKGHSTLLLLMPDCSITTRPKYTEKRLLQVKEFTKATPYTTFTAFCTAGFLLYNRELLRQCEKCGIYYISKTSRPSKYCSDKCRLAYHNRKRIESGAHREYKRKKRMEGAKESYYG